MEYKHFKIGGIFILNKPLEKDYFLCKLDLKMLIFQYLFIRTFKIFKVSMEGVIVLISLSALWPLLNVKDFYKACKSPNTNSQEFEYFDNPLPGQHSFNCAFTKRNDSCMGYIHFSVKTSGISNKCQKVSP